MPNHTTKKQKNAVCILFVDSKFELEFLYKSYLAFNLIRIGLYSSDFNYQEAIHEKRNPKRRVEWGYEMKRFAGGFKYQKKRWEASRQNFCFAYFMDDPKALSQLY